MDRAGNLYGCFFILGVCQVAKYSPSARDLKAASVKINKKSYPAETFSEIPFKARQGE